MMRKATLFTYDIIIYILIDSLPNLVNTFCRHLYCGLDVLQKLCVYCCLVKMATLFYQGRSFSSPWFSEFAFSVFPQVLFALNRTRFSSIISGTTGVFFFVKSWFYVSPRQYAERKSITFSFFFKMMKQNGGNIINMSSVASSIKGEPVNLVWQSRRTDGRTDKRTDSHYTVTEPWQFIFCLIVLTRSIQRFINVNFVANAVVVL